jgi:hypothetical protein
MIEELLTEEGRGSKEARKARVVFFLYTKLDAATVQYMIPLAKNQMAIYTNDCHSILLLAQMQLQIQQSHHIRTILISSVNIR